MKTVNFSTNLTQEQLKAAQDHFCDNQSGGMETFFTIECFAKEVLNLNEHDAALFADDATSAEPGEATQQEMDLFYSWYYKKEVLKFDMLYTDVVGLITDNKAFKEVEHVAEKNYRGVTIKLPSANFFDEERISAIKSVAMHNNCTYSFYGTFTESLVYGIACQIEFN